MDAEPHYLEMYPEKVTDVEVENDGHRAVVTWEPGNPPPLQYKVKWWNINQNTNEEENAILSNKFIFNQLVPGTVIVVKVAAQNSGGVGEFSDGIRIEAAPMAPTHITVTINPRFPDPTLSVNFNDPDPFPKTYIVTATNTEQDNDIHKVKTDKHSVNIPRLFSSNVYEVTVVAVEGELQSLPTRLSQPILTVPGKVSKLRHDKLSSRTFEITWKEEFGAESYEVQQWSVGDENFKGKKCCINQISLSDLELDNQYRIRVAARNRSGCGNFSDIYRFNTDPPLALPENVRVTNNKSNPKSAIDVTIEDRSTRQRSYSVLATLNGNVVERKETQCKTTVIGNLNPGHEYVVFVHCGDKDTSYHDMAKSRAIWTIPETVGEIERRMESRSAHYIEWQEVVGATSYEVECRKIGGSPSITATKHTNTLLKELKAGSEYAVRIRGKNSSGPGMYSQKHHFKTALKPPTDLIVVHNKQNPENTLDVKFKEPTPPAKQYKVIAQNLSGASNNNEKTVRSGFASIDRLVPGESYRISVASLDPENVSLTSEETESEEILTYPSAVQDVSVRVESRNSYIANWPQLKSADKYQISWRMTRGDYTEQFKETDQPHCTLLNLPTSTDCFIRVKAKNSSGWGKYSEEAKFRTTLSPPSNIRVTNADATPDSAIDIAFEHTDGANKYNITAKPTSGIEGTVDVVSENNNTKLTGLSPGKSYKVFVFAMCDDDKNLQSEVAESEEFSTSLSGLAKPTATRINNAEWKISWNKQTGADRYRLQWGIENQDKKTEPDTEETYLILRNAAPGKRYEVQIAPICNGTAQKPSEVQKFTTAPKTPDNLQYELISTEEVRLWCESSDGADTYEFKIDSDDIVTLPLEATSKSKPLSNNQEKERLLTSDSPEYKISYPFEKINFSVRAKNEGGLSLPSKSKRFLQVIRHVKQKFLKRAKDGISADDFAHVRLNKDSSTDNIDIKQPLVKPGETATIYGPLFSGKSVLCNYLIQSQLQHEVGILFDFFDLKNNAKKMDFGGLLKTTMPDLKVEEVKTLVSWLTKNQEEVLFIVENATVEWKFNPAMQAIDAKDVPKKLIYNLLKLDREILPRSRVICTTTQANLHTMIKPTKSLKLHGLSESGKTRMQEMHGKNYPNEELPHLALFLCSPGLSKAIMNLSSQRKRCDISSRASVLIEAMTQIFHRQSETLKNASLAVMKQEIERLQIEKITLFRRRKTGRTTNKLNSSAWEGSVYSSVGTESLDEPEATPASMDCMHLQELFLRAIIIALLMNCPDFEKLLKKKSGLGMQNAISLKITAGLLRDETIKKAGRLFSPILKLNTDGEAEKKRKALKQFISKNCEAIKNHVYSDSKLTLDWMECCVELGEEELWGKCSPQIKVKRNTTNEELRQLENFLKNPLAGNGKTTVSFKYNLPVQTKADVDTAIKQNPKGEAIRVKEYTKRALTRIKSHKILSSVSEGSYLKSSEPSESETDADESFDDAPDKDFAEGGNGTLGSHDQDCFDKGSTITLKPNNFGEDSTKLSGESRDKFETMCVEEHRKKDKETKELSLKEINLNASIVPDGIKVEWEKQDNAASYEVRLFLADKRDEELTKSTKGLQHVFKSYSFGKKHFCTVTALSEENEILGPSRTSNTVVKEEEK